VWFQPSYYALRVCLRADAPLWWSTATANAARAPAAMRAILNGRLRVELGADEAVAALAWARTIEGWPADGLPPVWVYPGDPAVDGAAQ
jgi:hypothetical protein